MIVKFFTVDQLVRLARRVNRVSALLALASLINCSLVLASTVQTVALTGQHAPGTPSGVIYSDFARPLLNDGGQVAFFADLAGNGVDSTNNHGIWSEGSGSLALIARTGNQAPGTAAGVKYSDLFAPVFNGAGQTAFGAALTGSGVDSTNNSGIWTERNGSLALVARTGNQAPGTSSGVNYNGFGWPALNDAAQTAFSAFLVGSGVNSSNDRGIWSEGSGSLALVARRGSQAPGTPSGANFGVFSHPVLNQAGRTAFYANLGTFFNSGIWSEGSGGVALVARSGDPAPGTPSGVNFSHWFPISPALNATGQAAFGAWLSGSGVDSTNDVGAWVGGSGNLTLVARSGDHAPGTPNGVNFSGGFVPVLNDHGEIAISSGLTGVGVGNTNDAGIWVGSPNNLSLVARKGEHAPGTPESVTYNELFMPVLNNAGQTAFLANLIGSGVNSTNDTGIWATNSSGALQLIARTGNTLEVAPGELRTIAALGFFTSFDAFFDQPDIPGNGDPLRSGLSRFNKLGQLAFRADFTDGSQGIFTSNQVAVLPGDFNGDGGVDAADYVVWRKTDGTSVGFSTWRANFGNTLSGGGSVVSTNDELVGVPEPAGMSLLFLAALTLGPTLMRKSAQLN